MIRMWTRLIVTVLLLGTASPILAQNQRPLPKVLVLATGGTIAGEQREPGTLGGYEIKKSVGEIVALIPNVQRYAEVETEQFSNVGSDRVTPELWLGLARRINDRFQERSDLAGIVVTVLSKQLETCPPS